MRNRRPSADVAPGVIDEDPAHDVCGDTKEWARFCQSPLPLIDEPDEHPVHEGRRLQGVVSPLGPKLAGRDAPHRVEPEIVVKDPSV